MAILQPSDFTDNPIYNIALTIQADSELETLIADVEKNIILSPDKLQKCQMCHQKQKRIRTRYCLVSVNTC